MNYTDYRISLDIFKTASQAVLPVKQGDTAYRLCITITANGSPYRITEGCYALFTAKKPDGNFINNECTIENNVIYYQLTPQTTAAIGVVECEVILYDSNDEQLATPHFSILVDAKAYNGEEIESTDETNMLEALIQDSITQINEVEEKLANGEFNGKDGKDGRDGVDGKDGKDGVNGKDGKDADYNLVCNALKGSASGNPIRIDDISPLEHEIAVGLRSKNLFNLAKISDNTVIVEGAGTPVSSSVFATSDYIAVPPNTAFVGSHIQYCTYYDKAKKYVGDIGSKSSTIERALTTPANAHYVRFSYQKSSTDGSNVQLEIGSTLSAYTPFVDVGGIEVSGMGANLTTAQAVYEGANAYLETVVDGRNCIRFTSGNTVEKKPITFKPNTQYTASFYAKNEDFRGATARNCAFAFFYEDGSHSAVQLMIDSPWNLFTITSDSGKTVTSIGVISVEYRAYVYLDTDTFMFNEGSTALPYEPYIEPTAYTADENGNVSVTSVYPSTTLTADNGVSISAEYNIDINNAFAKLMQAVAAAKEV